MGKVFGIRLWLLDRIAVCLLQAEGKRKELANREMGKTEIYGTIGPACAKAETLTEMFRLGMAGIRLNLSHTGLESCREWTELIKAAAKAAGKQPKLLIDLQGPELRIGELRQPVELAEGETAVFVESGKSGAGAASLPENDLAGAGRDTAAIPVPKPVLGAFKAGQEVLLDDGKILLQVLGQEEAAKAKEGILCKVLRGGTLKSRKSIALPGVRLKLPVLTESDRRNIRSARSHGVTGVMLPFVRSAEDLIELRQELQEADAGELEVFAKIENLEGVAHLEELLPFADQIVVARGDLGNSMPLWELPVVQAKIAGTCRLAGKPFLIVTQMLASMEEHPFPTRAEVSDIFRAVSEGAASVMVTGETAVGKYPAETIRYLVNTVRAAEGYCR